MYPKQRKKKREERNEKARAMEPAEEWAIKIQQTTGRKDAVVCWRRREESFLFWRVSALAHSPAQVRPLTDSFIITISADALRTRERNKIQRDAIQ